MSVKEIERAIAELEPKEVAQLADWFAAFHAELWERQIEADSKAGKHDHLIVQAKRDIDAGNIRPL